jgi:hypothetical protein
MPENAAWIRRPPTSQGTPNVRALGPSALSEPVVPWPFSGLLPGADRERKAPAVRAGAAEERDRPELLANESHDRVVKSRRGADDVEPQIEDVTGKDRD